MKIVKFLIEKVADGYTAYAAERSLQTEADTLEELNAQIQEALELQCEVTGEDPATLDLKLEYDLPTFFEVYPVVNVKALSERAGINNTLMSKYINGAKEPSTAQKERIADAIQQIGKELTRLSFA